MHSLRAKSKPGLKFREPFRCWRGRSWSVPHDRKVEGCLQALSGRVSHYFSIIKNLVTVGGVEKVDNLLRDLVMASPRTGCAAAARCGVRAGSPQHFTTRP